MYAETGPMFPYLPQEIQQFDDFCSSQKPNDSLGNLIQTSTISDYNLGGEGDLFKAPEPVIEELMMDLDPMLAAISMISCGEDVISPQAMSVLDIESSIKNGQLLSEVFYECKKDLLEKEAYEMPHSEVLDIKIPILKADEKLISESQFPKSVSSICLKSMEHMHEAPLGPNFIDFPGMDFGAVYGMRRAFSEGDIEVKFDYSTLSSSRYCLLAHYLNAPRLLNMIVLLIDLPYIIWIRSSDNHYEALKYREKLFINV